MSDGTDKIEFSIPTGQSNIKVVFNKSSEASKVTASSIELIGINESNGGNLACLTCPEGFLSTKPGSTTCEPCPLGTSLNQEKNACVPCKKGYYTPSVGSRCLTCPPMTESSSDSIYCFPQNHFLWIANDNEPTAFYPSLFSANVTNNKSISVSETSMIIYHSLLDQL